MIPFLKLVANDVYTRFNGQLENVAIVFPNKRAGLFFNQYLLENSGNRPIWSPRYMTISELFCQHSKLAVGDPILLVSKLYKQYVRPQRSDETLQEYEKNVETLDSFYYWGEMLIKDFDDVDKNMANAKQLFSNLKELRELGTAKDTLTKEQIEAIGNFFENFQYDEENTKQGEGCWVKENFVKIWERLYEIYTGFKSSLEREHIAYEGMLYRDVVERIDELEFEYDKYVFVGFNALNGVENRLFTELGRRGKALYYWDYDDYYVKDRKNEAGDFMRRNLERYPNALPRSIYNNMVTDKNVNVVSASSNGVQARYVSQWLDCNMTANEIETAVVLCDETLLEPVLHVIPQQANGNELRYMNVTMGYPISNTPVFGLVKLLVELQTRGWSEKQGTFMLSQVCNVLKHPYIIRQCNESAVLHDSLMFNKRFYPTSEELCNEPFLARIFTRITDNKEWMESIAAIIFDISKNYSEESETNDRLYDKLFCEAILKVYTQAQRLIRLLEGGELKMQQSTVGKLFVKMLSRQSMPFHGEPVVGLQIMGLLETRNLDFKNVIMLSVNEGNMPRNSGENSFIPYNLRRAFGLTLSEQRDSIYAYNFYRLIQRAQNVTLVYNNSTGGKIKGECSRYILQLLGSNLYDITRYDLNAEQGSDNLALETVVKSHYMVEKLRSRFDTGISSKASVFTPSAINRYIRCKLSFFYYYILGLKQPVEVNTEMTTLDFGSIFHKAAELFYEELSKNNGDLITVNMLEYYIANPALLYKYVNNAFVEIFFKGGKAIYNGEQFINRSIVHRFLLRLLRMDKKYAPFRYICSEKDIAIPYTVSTPNGDVKLKIGGTIDRIDIKGDTINIVDYKTGRMSRDKGVTLEAIFANEVSSASNRLQSCLYSTVLDKVTCGEAEKVYCSDYEWVDKVKSSKCNKISPSLLYLSKGEENLREEFTVEVNGGPINDIATIKEEYLKRLDAVIGEIFDEMTPFESTSNSDNCKFCDYRSICGK